MKMLKLYLFLVLTFVINIASAENSTPKILVMGDSLSAGYGIDLQQGWVSLLQEDITFKNHWRIINASVSGETSTGGRERLSALLKQHQPQIVLLELGGNDGLRGQPLKILLDNLQNMIDASKAAGAKVILAGMQIPPNYGARYARQFQNLYVELAEKNDAALIPFLLAGVADNKALMQNDGIHPTAEAQPLIVKNVMPVLKKVAAEK
jgi:acyl-CoA thioesterase-1